MQYFKFEVKVRFDFRAFLPFVFKIAPLKFYEPTYKFIKLISIGFNSQNEINFKFCSNTDSQKFRMRGIHEPVSKLFLSSINNSVFLFCFRGTVHGMDFMHFDC